VLEREYLSFILRPHTQLINEVYGIDSQTLADGLYAISISMREGHYRAITALGSSIDDVQHLMDESGLPLVDAIDSLRESNPRFVDTANGALLDLFHGGICDLSRHTELPQSILEDLAYSAGANTEFFAQGPFKGTPMRTVPARIRPLVRLGDSYYAPEPRFVMDAAYRAIQRGIKKRKPDSAETWNLSQKQLTETAFERIFSNQLLGAAILTDVYYRDPDTDQWVENDTLIMLGDVMLQVESKGGGGPMKSPETDFDKYAGRIDALVSEAHRQTTRFLRYLASKPSVPVYRIESGQYIEVLRVELAAFRVVLPIGLTIESLSPLSTNCKRLPGINPILGLHPFVSLSIDDLFVLNRFLPTTGELFHYLEVRQAIAGIREAFLFDENDHLGAYLEKNRFDLTLKEQIKSGANTVVWDGLSDRIDEFFSSDYSEFNTARVQSFPEPLTEVLTAIGIRRSPSWLAVDSYIRDLSGEARSNLAGLIRDQAKTLKTYTERTITFDSLFVFIHRSQSNPPQLRIEEKAEIACLSMELSAIFVLQLELTIEGKCISARTFKVNAPPTDRENILDISIKAALARNRMIDLRTMSYPSKAAIVKKKLGVNDRCWCGSKRKYKKCHGGPPTSQ
jgi:hypothetical protein